MRTAIVRPDFPIDLWTVATPDERSVSATLVREGRTVTLAWFVDGGVEGVEDFENRDEALRHADAVRQMYLRWGTDGPTYGIGLA